MHQGERRLLWIEICKLENLNYNQNTVLPPLPDVLTPEAKNWMDIEDPDIFIPVGLNNSSFINPLLRWKL